MAKNDSLVDEATGEVIAPFPADTASMEAEQMQALIERERPDLMTPELAGRVQTIDAVTGQLPLVHKDSLVDQPFVVMMVRVLPGRATQSDEGEDLIMALGQVVKLDKDQKITQTGIHFIVTAGDEVSVFGQEMLSILEACTPNDPVLCAYGLTKRDVERGHYYTTRPTAQNYDGDLFPEAK